MRCHEVRLYLQLRHPAGVDELGEEVRNAVQEHLRSCARCAELNQQYELWDRQLANALRQVAIPADLHESLKRQAAAARGKELRFCFYRYVGVAAGVLLLISLGWLGYEAYRPTLDTRQLVLQNDTWLQDPAVALPQWLEQQGLPSKLPEPFDLNLLEHAGYELVQGQMVPVLLFRHPERPGMVAKVYLFKRGGGVRLRQLNDADASHTVARVIDEPQQFRGVTYVIVYPAGPEGLRPFLRPNPVSS